MTTNNKLLQCPFCSGPAVTDFIEGESYMIECSDCGCRTEGLGGPEEAIAAWNRRPPAMPADADISEWMECESRRSYVVNSLKTRALGLRDTEQRCRTAFRKDFMGKPSQYLADAYGEAAAVFESRLSALAARRRIEVEQSSQDDDLFGDDEPVSDEVTEAEDEAWGEMEKRQ